jgi:hypothetical protein
VFSLPKNLSVNAPASNRSHYSEEKEEQIMDRKMDEIYTSTVYEALYQ